MKRHFLHESAQLPFTGFSQGITGCRFFTPGYDDALFSAFGVRFPPSLDTAVPLRRAEYLAGRVLAKRNMAALNLPDTALLPDTDGVPQWPAGIVGSLSHTRSMVVCATMLATQVKMIGIDVESIMTPEDAHTLWSHIISPQEYHYLQAQPQAFHHMLALAFSAKESFYKMVFPISRTAIQFHSVRLIDVDFHACTFLLTVPTELTALFAPHSYAAGTFLQQEENIITLMVRDNRRKGNAYN